MEEKKAEEFKEIPGYPGYFINAAGCVKSRYGELEPDAKGRFRLSTGKRNSTKKIPVENLLALVDFSASLPENAQDKAAIAVLEQEINDLKADNIALQKRLESLKHKHELNRKLNVALWNRLRRFEAAFSNSPLTANQKRTLLYD